MKKVYFAPLIAAAMLAACGGEEPAQTPNYSVNAVAPVDEGGPCGDGTELGPNEHCK